MLCFYVKSCQLFFFFELQEPSVEVIMVYTILVFQAAFFFFWYLSYGVNGFYPTSCSKLSQSKDQNRDYKNIHSRNDCDMSLFHALPQNYSQCFTLKLKTYHLFANRLYIFASFNRVILKENFDPIIEGSIIFSSCCCVHCLLVRMFTGAEVAVLCITKSGEVVNYQAFTNSKGVYTVAETMPESERWDACLARPISSFHTPCHRLNQANIGIKFTYNRPSGYHHAVKPFVYRPQYAPSY